jgi:hypothetical protein
MKLHSMCVTMLLLSNLMCKCEHQGMHVYLINSWHVLYVCPTTPARDSIVNCECKTFAQKFETSGPRFAAIGALACKQGDQMSL